MAGADLSDENAGPAEPAIVKANSVLEDAASRRKFRLAAFWLTVLAAGYFSALLYHVVVAIASEPRHFSPWLVGIIASLVVSISVMVLALLHATFAPPESSGGKAEKSDLPQAALAAGVLKSLGDIFSAAGKTLKP